MKKTVFILILFSFILASAEAPALQRGAILYHTSKGDNIYGRTNVLELPCSAIQLALRDMKSGHVGLYIGNNRIIHAVTPTVEETASENFIPQSDLDEGCRYLGAKVPLDFDNPAIWPAERVDQLIILAREQVGADYDIQFRHQKGPYVDGFTCVGLVEYLYENIDGDPYDITPNGYYSGGAGGRTYTQTYNCESTLWGLIDDEGMNTFAEEVEFSSFEHPLAGLLDVGLQREGDDNRYMFFPYTQYLQAKTVDVATDITVSGGGDSDDGDGGCFIATAAYGSALHPHLDILREFRDSYMKSNPIGRLFLSVYERYAPFLAGLVERHEVLKSLTRFALLPVLGLCFILLYTGPLILLALLAAVFIWRFRLACR